MITIDDLGPITHSSTLVNEGYDTECFFCGKPLPAGGGVRRRGACHETPLRKAYIFMHVSFCSICVDRTYTGDMRNFLEEQTKRELVRQFNRQERLGIDMRKARKQ